MNNVKLRFENEIMSHKNPTRTTWLTMVATWTRTTNKMRNTGKCDKQLHKNATNWSWLSIFRGIQIHSILRGREVGKRCIGRVELMQPERKESLASSKPMRIDENLVISWLDVTSKNILSRSKSVFFPLHLNKYALSLSVHIGDYSAMKTAHNASHTWMCHCCECLPDHHAFCHTYNLCDFQCDCCHCVAIAVGRILFCW